MAGECSRLPKKGILQDHSLEPCSLSLEDLKSITNNFSNQRLLGEGGFGKVYKGVLQNGKIIAVKKFSSSIPGPADRHFENEAHHLMRLKHSNVVLLEGCCSETKEKLVMYKGKLVCAEETERLLCFEYMPKGNLRGYLSDESSGLDWGLRYKIIEGICSGLHYLHEEWQVGTPIIHMDLKPANILLDENMVPKIADFGLARLFGEEQTRTCTKSCEGTVGYMAPEYINRGIITKSLDIFSLGVIIIEIVTGHKEYPEVTETSSEEFTEIVLKNWRNRLKKELGSTSAVINYKEIRRCIQIGLACVKLDRSKRPTISQIVKILHESEGTECSNREVSDREGKLFTSLGPAASLDTLNTLDPAEPNNPLAIKGFTFSAVNCWRTSTKLFCCEFSSDGKMLASAGVEKKAVLWNLEAFETQYTSEEHRLVIADVSFRPKSTQLATSSFDRTIKLWNTADPKFSLHTFTGHPYQVVSLDFHPTKTDLLCSCDAFGEIRYWNVNRLKCERTMKGADCRVRFQPNAGRFLAAADANENVVSVFDIETHKRTYALQGHGEWMQSLCWDNSGKYLATVSPHQVKVWSISSGECIHELTSNGKEFHSCVFHPGYANLLLIGGHQTLDIWNMVNNQSITVRAHEGLVATLAQSPVNGIVASATYDYSVKLWK